MSFSTVFHSVSSFAKLHEKLIAVVVGGLLLWGVTGKIQDAIVAHDQKVYAARSADLQAQVAANAVQAQTVAKLAADNAALAQTVKTQNAQLEAINAKLSAALTQQRQTDAVLPSPELAQRATVLAHLTPDAIAPVVGSDGFVVERLGLVSIVQELEAVPVLTQQVGNLQTEKGNLEKQIASQSELVTGLNNQVTGLQSEIAKAGAANKAEVALVKAQATKSKRKWFVIGFVAGLAVRGAATIFGGV